MKKEKTMKIYFAGDDGESISVTEYEVEEKPKTYKVVSGDRKGKIINKNEIGFASFEFVHGYGLTPEQAVETYRKSATQIRDGYQRRVNFYNKLANLPVEAA